MIPIWVRALGLSLVAVVAVTLAAGAVGLSAMRPTIAWGTLAVTGIAVTAWVWRSPDRRRQWRAERRWWCAVVLVPVAFAALLWPRLTGDGLNGDGTEAFEIARSLQGHAFPHWEIESATAPARYGVSVAVPYFTGAALAQLPMGIVGAQPLAVRLLMPVALAWLLLLVVAAVPTWSAAGRMYLVIGVAALVVWSITWVSYDPPFDLAEPAGTNLVTTLFFVLGVWEAVRGAAPMAAALWVSACMTTFGGPVLLMTALPALVWCAPTRARQVWWWTAGLGGAALSGLLVVGVATGDLAWWVAQVHGEYWRDLVGGERRVDAWPIVWRWGVLLGGAPFLVLARWRDVSPLARLLSLTALGYVTVVVLGADKSLHYLMPIPLLVWPAALAVGRPRELVVAAMVASVALVGGWPSRIGPDDTPQALGRDSCVRGLDFQSATLASRPIEDALASPRQPDRLGVSRHPWLWHAMTDTTGRCVVGLSRDLPPGGTLLVSGDQAMAWTTDLDAFVAWRFHPARWVTAWLFPRAPMVPYPVDVQQWPDEIDLQQAPGEGLVIMSSTTADRRVLVPAGNPSTWLVTLESEADASRSEVTVLVVPERTWGLTAVADGVVPVRLRRVRE